jgi:DNA-binding transcriptional LysR family regulator
MISRKPFENGSTRAASAKGRFCAASVAGSSPRSLGLRVGTAYRRRSGAGIWETSVQTMVMAGMGNCFLPEYSVVVPGLQTRRVIEPDVIREVSVVTVAGRRFSPAVAAFVRAIKAYPWSTSAPDLSSP